LPFEAIGFMTNSPRDRRNEQVKPVNPYESPLAPVRRRPFLVRLRDATRRAFAAYRAEIRRQNINSGEHLGAWMSLSCGCLIALVIVAVLIVILIGNILPA